MDYFIEGLDKKAGMEASAKITKKMHEKYSHVILGIECFTGTFLLQTKEGANPYQTSPKHVEYTL